MVAKAQSRVELLKSAQGLSQANVYGETQLGGLGRIYVLTAPAAAYGLPENPKYPVMATVQKVLQPLGQVAFGGTILAAITAWIIARRNVRMEEVE